MINVLLNFNENVDIIYMAAFSNVNAYGVPLNVSGAVRDDTDARNFASHLRGPRRAQARSLSTEDKEVHKAYDAFFDIVKNPGDYSVEQISDIIAKYTEADDSPVVRYGKFSGNYNADLADHNSNVYKYWRTYKSHKQRWKDKRDSMVAKKRQELDAKGMKITDEMTSKQKREMAAQRTQLLREVKKKYDRGMLGQQIYYLLGKAEQIAYEKEYGSDSDSSDDGGASAAAKKGGRRTRKKRGGGPEAAAADEAAPKIEWVIENTEGRINSFVNSDVPQRGDGFNNMIQQMRNRISDGGFWIVEWNEARDVHDDYNHYHLAWDDEDNEPPDLIRFPFPPLPTQAGGKKRKKRKRKKRKKKKSRKKRGGRKLNLFLSEINNRLRDVERRGEEREDEIRSNSAEIRDNDAAIIGNGDDITENAVDIGVIKSYINYKLNNTLENAATPLDQWQGHLRSIDRRSHQEQPSLIDRQILTDANMRGGMKKTRKMKGGHHLYKRLGVSKYASQKTIKKAYNKIKKNKKITNKVKYAYKILSKKKTRKQYNNKYVKHKKLKRKKNKR